MLVCHMDLNSIVKKNVMLYLLKQNIIYSFWNDPCEIFDIIPTIYVFRMTDLALPLSYQLHAI